MPMDGYLKIPDIPGESRVEDHEDEIEVHGVSFAMAAPTAAGGARRGRVTLEPLTIDKFYDRSSPYLKKAVHDNTRLDAVVLSLVRIVDGQTRDYLVVRLEGASITAYSMSDAEAPDRLEERLTFSYRSIRFTYDGDHEVELDAVTDR